MSDDQTGVNRRPGAAAISHLQFPVVGLCASAGGLMALKAFLEHSTSDSGMAFVVILHLSPRHESNAGTILQRDTRMPVVQVNTDTRIEANHVYVISPMQELRMNDGMLQVKPLERPMGRHVAIDAFFRTLGEAHQDRAVGIVLSGTGADGAVGLAYIKEQGGVTLAQSLDDAEYEDMPRNAIASGSVDFVLPVSDMPSKLAQLWENARELRLPEPLPEGGHMLPVPPDQVQHNERALREILDVLAARTGNDFGHYKRATVLRRIERRMQVTLRKDLPSYRDFLRSDADEPRALLDDMLIGVTQFFRDREAFETLEREVIPALFSEDPTEGGPRVWVPGCSTGEEAYSLAILMADHAELMASPPHFQLFATDISEQAIAKARTGIYPESIVPDVPPARLRQFFASEQGHYRINKTIRDRVLFAIHNALRDPPFSRIDLISCRNLLIYLERDVQQRLLELFHFALRPGGMLFLGSSESADAAAQFFDVVDKKQRIYRARSLSRRARQLSMPSLPSEPRPVEQPAHAPMRRGFSFLDVHQRVLEYYGPPSAVVDSDGNIVHMSAHAGDYLRFQGGEPTNSIIAMIDPALRMDLRTVLYHAQHSNEATEAQALVERDGASRMVRLTARPFEDEEADASFVLLTFDEAEAVAAPHAIAPADRSDVFKNLERELQRTKDRLQATIEQSEASGEELKASNEELQAINEELRSASEELETSKEELQSVNEELITVNYELKSKVEETAKVNDDLQNFIASTDIATLFVDAGLRIKRYTPRTEHIFNIIPSDVGRCLLDITHRLEYPDLAADASNAFESLQLREREIRSIDGHWYVVRVLPYRTSENRIDGAVLTFIDTTSLRGTGPRMLSEDQLRAAPEAQRAPAIVLLDDERRVVAWDAGAAELLGYSEASRLATSLDDLYLPEDREQQVPENDFAVASKDGRIATSRFYINNRGDRIPCNGVLTRIHGADGVAFALILRPRPEDQDVAASARSADAREMRMMSQRDEFLAIMSHELKNPLNQISVSAELLARLPEFKQSLDAATPVDIIRRAARAQAKIIDDLLDMSRIRTGKLTLKPEPVDLTVIIHDLVQMARMNVSATDIDIQVQTPNVPVIVRGDAARLGQIVSNLLGNAIKFTPAGGQIKVAVQLEESYVRVQVIDNGRGIDPRFLPGIFDLFDQGGRNGMRGGLGLGLALVKQLVELHGGRVSAHSEGLGRGASFTVQLPRFSYSMPGVAEPAATVGSDGRWQGVRLLLVDDDTPALNALAQLMELLGADVTTANSAAQGLERCAESQFDVVMSDVGMPEMDGYAFARALRAQDVQATLVALTGYARPDDIQQARNAGFDLHLGKPFSLEALEDLLPKRRSA